jgi:hypothetical protein
MLDSHDLARLRAALARLKTLQDRSKAEPTVTSALYPNDLGMAVWDAGRALPVAELLAVLGEVERLREACRRAIIVLEGPNPGICDTIWADDATTLVDLLTAALSAPAPDGGKESP